MDVRLGKGLEGRRTRDGLVLLRRADGTFYQLNRTAADFWEILSDGRGFDEAVDRIARKYGAEPGRVRDDLTALVRRLVDRGLMEADACRT